MKTMKCNQLGGACEKEFRADTFEEIAEISKQHGMEMYQKNDEAHLNAMNKMQELMKVNMQLKSKTHNNKLHWKNLHCATVSQ